MNKEGEDLITQSEDIRLTAYLCPAGVPTIGRGHTDGVTLDDVRNKRTITAEEERSLFKSDMVKWEKDVRALCIRTPDEYQLAAMVSLAFNIGLGGPKKPGFSTSTVLKAFNAGDDAAAARAFLMWNKYTNPKTGKREVSEGLVLRRAREAALYMKATPQQEYVRLASGSPDMPQEVAAPVTMATSKINISAAATGVGAATAMATSVLDSLNGFKTSFDKLGHWAIPLILAVVIAGAAWTLYERHQLRKDGVV